MFASQGPDTGPSRPSIGFTFMDALNSALQRSMKKLDGKGTALTPLDHGGRIWMLWNPSLFTVNVLDVTPQAIHSEVLDNVKGVKFRMTSVYGFNKLSDRSALWHSLLSYAKGFGSWVIIGDFNNAMFRDERIGSDISWAEIKSFQDTCNSCSLHTLKTVGAFFTWNNKHEVGSIVFSRIDRVLINDEWLLEQPDSVASFLPEGLYDHSPCILSINKEKFQNIETTCNIAEKALRCIQEELHKNPKDKMLKENESIAAQEVRRLTKAKQLFLSQKANLQWAMEGDDNTAYFHAVIKKRRVVNKVFQITNMHGELVEEPGDVNAAFEEFYKDLMGSATDVKQVHFPLVQQGRMVTPKHVDILLQPVSPKETKDAIFSMPGSKAAGPDGYSSQFIKDAWEIVGDSVVAAVMDFFEHGRLLKQLNHTILTLIPKVELSTLKISGFKYHSLCKKAELSHLCSVDDLLLFCYGNVQSVNILLSSFGIFSAASGLKINQGKSNVYMNGVDPEVKEALIRCTGMKLAGLPFKYLGVPISVKKLSVLDCAVLVEKVVLRIRALGARKLSYGGRLTLVQSVLSCLHNYWAKIFLLPKSVIKKIDEVCRNFLWQGDIHYTKAPPMSWAKVCCPKNVGGLGLINSALWNIVVVSKYVWWLASKKDHLWVGFLIHKWGLDGKEYSIQAGYHWLLDAQVKAVWHAFVWNRLVMSKHCVVTWLIVQQRLLTRDRLLRRGMSVDSGCLLCEQAAESHEHLFFGCSYSKLCLQLVSEWAGVSIPWHTPVQWWLRCIIRPLLKKHIIGAAIGILMYLIWRERNYCLHDRLMRAPKRILVKLKYVLSARIQCNVSMKLKSKYPDLVRGFMS
ncbi:uncharacterized protein LOC141601352 [Silene latifolia]|uniref:uncharacterized protein LOC141601352 n=1 Tax=Silene latifolia TaxID=37657 RepID=UPI003D77445B